MADKYVSALTGPEMDTALQDMAQHNSEAWAVGERGGIPVASNDRVYHNNAQYYSDQASSAAARAEAAVPPGTAGALFFDRAQALTDSEKRQVYSNLSINPAPAPNMVDNAWFLVNQRGQSSYSTTGKFIFDRWRLNSGSVQWSADGITNPSSSLGAIIDQSYETQRFFAGTYYRVSVLLSDGTIYSARMTVDTTYHYIPSSGDNRPFRMRFDTGGKNIHFQMLAASYGMTVRAVKVEKTFYSTLSLDVIPDEAEELVKAYRYLYVIRSRSTVAHICPIYYRTTSSWRAVVPLPALMAAAPTVSVSSGLAADLVIYTGSSSTAYASSSFTVTNANSYYAVAITLTNSNAPSTTGIGTFAVANSSALIISAEI